MSNVRDIEVAEHAIDLTERAENLYRRAEQVLHRVEGQAVLELAAVRELRAVIELLAKLTAPPPIADTGPVEIRVSFASRWDELPVKPVPALPAPAEEGESR